MERPWLRPARRSSVTNPSPKRREGPLGIKPSRAANAPSPTTHRQTHSSARTPSPHSQPAASARVLRALPRCPLSVPPSPPRQQGVPVPSLGALSRCPPARRVSKGSPRSPSVHSLRASAARSANRRGPRCTPSPPRQQGFPALSLGALSPCLRSPKRQAQGSSVPPSPPRQQGFPALSSALSPDRTLFSARRPPIGERAAPRCDSERDSFDVSVVPRQRSSPTLGSVVHRSWRTTRRRSGGSDRNSSSDDRPVRFPPTTVDRVTAGRLLRDRDSTMPRTAIGTGGSVCAASSVAVDEGKSPGVDERHSAGDRLGERTDRAGRHAAPGAGRDRPGVRREFGERQSTGEGAPPPDATSPGRSPLGPPEPARGRYRRSRRKSVHRRHVSRNASEAPTRRIPPLTRSLGRQETSEALRQLGAEGLRVLASRGDKRSSVRFLAGRAGRDGPTRRLIGTGTTLKEWHRVRSIRRISEDSTPFEPGPELQGWIDTHQRPWAGS